MDDNATNRRILKETLTRWGMKPTLVEGGQEALMVMEQAVSQGQPFRLVLLDQMMPEMDGFTLAERIKDRPELAGSVMMMLSSAGRPGDSAHCRALGMAAYLTKPFKQSELLDMIVTTLLGGTHSAHAVAPRPHWEGEEGKPNGTRASSSSRRGRSARERGAVGSCRLLLAEDNLVNQRLALRVLEKQGHTVTIVGNGLEAVAAWENSQREGVPFDLILMDIQMPEKDGFEATRDIREREEAAETHTPIVAMTAHAMKGDRERVPGGRDGRLPLQAAPGEAAPGGDPETCPHGRQ